MYCKNCGKEIQMGTQFCPYCGTNQSQISYSNATNKVVTSQESKIWGILSLLFGILGGLFGLVFGIVGLCTYKEKQNKLMCKIGIACFTLWILIPIIIIILYFLIVGATLV